MATSSSKGGRRNKKNAGEDQELLTIRRNLDEVYKPYFDQYAEEGGIPISALREVLMQANEDQMDQEKIEWLLQKADQNSDNVLDYVEFVRLMTSDQMPGRGTSVVLQREFSQFQKVLRTAVCTVVPVKRDDGVVQDYISEFSCCPPPFFMFLISITEIVIFITYALIERNKGKETRYFGSAPINSPLVFNPKRRYEVWRYLSYMLIHDGIHHIVSNIIFQMLIGLPLELFHKYWRVAIVYLLGVVAGSLISSVFDGHTYLVGASGGCYALVGAHFATIIMNWKNMTDDWMSGPVKFITSAPVQLTFWLVYISVDIGVAIWSRHYSTSKVSYAAHFGGFVAGVLVGIPVLKNIQVLNWEKVVKWVAVAIYLCIIVFALCWNIFYPDFPKTDWTTCCPPI